MSPVILCLTASVWLLIFPPMKLRLGRVVLVPAAQLPVIRCLAKPLLCNL
jgi:hypothetical protein